MDAAVDIQPALATAALGIKHITPVYAAVQDVGVFELEWKVATRVLVPAGPRIVVIWTKLVRNPSQGLSHAVLHLEPGQRQPWGHRHKTQEEIYVVVAGAGKAKLGDEDVEVGELDAIRVAPELARNFEAGPDGLALLAFGAPRPPDQQPVGDAEMLPGWWGDEDF